MQRGLLILLFLSLLPAQAYYPSTQIYFDNVRINGQVREGYEDKFLDFLDKFPEVLKPENKKFKVDQECSFTIELDKNGMYLMDSIKVKEMGKNIPYNLKAIEFLRQNPIKLIKHEPDEPVTIKMKYLAF